ncbi:unnamed protein product [Brassica rapa subsp. narinosa]
MGNKSGYGSEPAYRGDVEFGYGDEYDDEEEDVKLLFWGVKSYRFFLLSDCLGRRLGPSFLGRVDDSERLARDFYTILNEVSLLCYVLANFMNDFAIWQGMEYGMNEDSLREAFRKYGDVVESKNTGRGGLGLLHSPLPRRPLVLSKIMESDEFKASSKLETVTFSEMKQEEIEALVEFMYCVVGSISLESLKKHVG